MPDEINNKKPYFSVTLGGELKQGWDDTSRLNQRLESFAILKQRTQQFITWAVDEGVTQEKLHQKTFRNLDKCGEYLIFRNYLTSNRSRLIGACSCKQHLLCAFCASRRGVKQSVSYKERVELLKASTDQQLDLVFITFTVKNGESLNERFTHLRNSMRYLLKRRNNQSRVKYTHETEMFKFTGGVFAYEFKRGSGSKDWHPHIHMLALLPKSSKIDISLLKQEWLEITGDSSVINIEYANDNAYLEVFAYALKFSELAHVDRWHAFKLLKGERLISSFGDLRGIDIPEDETDDVLQTDEPFIDVLFKWCSRRGYELHSKLTN